MTVINSVTIQLLRQTQTQRAAESTAYKLLARSCHVFHVLPPVALLRCHAQVPSVCASSSVLQTYQSQTCTYTVIKVQIEATPVFY